MITAKSSLTSTNAYTMTYDHLNAEECSIFIAYGDTETDLETILVREGSDFLWPPTSDGFHSEVRGEELRFRECIRNGKYLGCSSFGY